MDNAQIDISKVIQQAIANALRQRGHQDAAESIEKSLAPVLIDDVEPISGDADIDILQAGLDAYSARKA